MDFEMPGMDGYQALKIIKSNPSTATIPVMMYTSKEGGLVLSQARALGAVGVLPKQLEAQDLDAMVRELHLLPEQTSLVDSYEGRDEEFVPSTGLQHESRDFDNVQILSGNFKNEPKIEYPEEAYDETVFVLKRQTRIFQKELLSAEQRMLEYFGNEFSKLKQQTPNEDIHEPEPSRWARRTTVIFASITFLLLLLLGIWIMRAGYSFNNALNTQSQQIAKAVQQITAEVDQLGEKITTLTLESGSPVDDASALHPAPKITREGTLDLLEWAANRGNEFEYGENPYGNTRVLWLSELVGQLKNASFRGVVHLKAKYANFCLTKSDTGAIKLAGDQLPVEECLFSQDTSEKGFAQSSYQTIEFAYYINDLASNEATSIEVVIDSDEHDDPQTPYADGYAIKNAGEWNNIARKNQRILVSLFRRMDV